MGTDMNWDELVMAITNLSDKFKSLGSNVEFLGSTAETAEKWAMPDILPEEEIKMTFDYPSSPQRFYHDPQSDGIDSLSYIVPKHLRFQQEDLMSCYHEKPSECNIDYSTFLKE